MGLFGTYDVPEQPETAEAPYPRLVDVPTAPPPGSFTADAPDPSTGVALRVALGDEAAAQNEAARRLDGPVLTEADRRALGR
ncbi:MAG: hypothetical protein AAF675_11160 [Pseudomonadota bacterium]